MRRIMIGLVALTIAVSQMDTAAAEDEVSEKLFKCQKPKGRIQIEFKPELTLRELLSWAGAFSCESILFTNQIANRRLQIDIIAPKRLRSQAAWSLFRTALRAMGLEIVKKAGTYVVIEAPEAKKHALPVVVGKRPKQSGFVRSLMTAEHLTGAELATALGPLSSKSGEIKALPRSQMVLITDYADHIRRMADLLDEIDRGHAADEGVYVVPVKHADVAELATTVEAILGASPERSQTDSKTTRRTTKSKDTPLESGGATTTVIAEPRTKAIVVVASRSAFARARSIIERLDVEVDEQSSHIHMIELEHADAEKMSTTLTALLSGRQQPAQNQNRRTTRPTRGAVSVDGDVRVTHDEASNSLLIMATMRDFLGLREIVRRLDSTKPQVYIEAMILEVSISGDNKLGSSFHFGGESDGATWVTGLGHDGLRSTDLKSLIGVDGLLGGIFGSPLEGLNSFLGQSIPSYGVLFSAIATSRNADLVSSPRIMTTDSTPATLKVSERRREPGATTTVATGGTTQAVESVDASLTLNVTPHVNSTDDVRLEIELIVEEFLPARSEALGSDKSSREIKNTVVVRDQESVIIGGLIIDREVKTESKIPLLGDLPLLGYLFKQKRSEKEKRNLVVLLTPYVLDSRADHDYIVRQNMNERAEFLRAHMRLKDKTPETHVDYRKKRGLLETINRRALEVEREKAERSRLEKEAPEREVLGPL